MTRHLPAKKPNEKIFYQYRNEIELPQEFHYLERNTVRVPKIHKMRHHDGGPLKKKGSPPHKPSTAAQNINSLASPLILPNDEFSFEMNIMSNPDRDARNAGINQRYVK